nr:hypothetical protein [Alistipes finegoldii]
MDSRTERQDGAQNKAAEQGGKTDRQDGSAGRGGKTGPVSYTHLTLPTICSV